jgi:hypothetical protein
MKDVMDLPESEPDYDPLDAVLLLEAISCLEDEDDRFILLKELEGYSPKELSQMLAEKWRKRGQIKIRKVPNTSDGSSYCRVYIHKKVARLERSFNYYE